MARTDRARGRSALLNVPLARSSITRVTGSRPLDPSYPDRTEADHKQVAPSETMLRIQPYENLLGAIN